MKLDGKEIDKKIGDVGSYSVDVDNKGMIKIELQVGKVIEDGIKISSQNAVEVSVFTLLEKVVEKTEAKWDDALVAQLKAILGLAG